MSSEILVYSKKKKKKKKKSELLVQKLKGPKINK